MRHKQLQQRIEKWVAKRSGLAAADECSPGPDDALKAAIPQDFAGSDPPTASGRAGAAPGSPAKSAAAASVGATTVGPSSVRKKARNGVDLRPDSLTGNDHLSATMVSSDCAKHNQTAFTVLS